MSIAYQALVLFAFVLPGILFRKRLSAAGQFRQQRSLADELAQSTICAVILHAAGIALCNHVFAKYSGVQIDLPSAVMHAMGQFGTNSEHFDDAISALTTNIWWVALYFTCINLFAMFLGDIFKQLRDSKFTFWNCEIWGWLGYFDDHEPADVRFKEWGNFFGEPPKDGVEIDLLAAVVEFGKAPYLLVGQLIKPCFGPDGNPERFILKNVMRRALIAADNNPREKKNEFGFHEIEGDNFVLRTSEVKTFNIVRKYLQHELTAEITELPDKLDAELQVSSMLVPAVNGVAKLGR